MDQRYESQLRRSEGLIEAEFCSFREFERESSGAVITEFMMEIDSAGFPIVPEYTTTPDGGAFALFFAALVKLRQSFFKESSGNQQTRSY